MKIEVKFSLRFGVVPSYIYFLFHSCHARAPSMADAALRRPQSVMVALHEEQGMMKWLFPGKILQSSVICSEHATRSPVTFCHLFYMLNSISVLALVCLGCSASNTLCLALGPAKVTWVLKALAQGCCVVTHIPWWFLTCHVQFHIQLPQWGEVFLTPSPP